MEDYILREVSKIGQMIEAMLSRIRRGKQSGEEDVVYSEMSKTELAENLGVGIDEFIVADNFIGILVEKHGLNDDQIELFAELLFDFAIVSDECYERIRYISRVTDIYKYLINKGRSLSFSSFCILQELDKYQN